MNPKMNLLKIFLSALIINAFLFQSVPVKAQDIVASDDISSSSSVFVFRKSSKASQSKFVARTTAKRNTVQRVQSRKLVRDQVAKVTPKRTNIKKVDPNTVAAVVKPKNGQKPKPIPTTTKIKASDDLAGAAETYLEKGDADTAVEYFRQAIELNPKNQNAKLGLSEALSEQGDQLADAHSLVAALPVYQEALKFDDKNASAYAGLGSVYDEQEKTDLALTNYEKALELNPKLTELYASTGILYYEKGEVAKADEYLTKALANSPQDSETQYFLGLVRYKQNRNDEALAALKQSIQLKETPEAHYYLGEVYDRLDRDKEALAEYNKAVALNPRYREAWFDLGAANYNRGRYEEAINSYSQAIKLENDNAEAHANLADVYRQLKQYAKAEGEYQLATVLYERMPKEKVSAIELAELYSRYGFVLGRLSKWNSAITTLTKAITISPDKVDYTNIGWAYLNAGQLDRANKKDADAQAKLAKGAEYLQKAIAQDDKFVAAYMNLGVTYNESGNFQGAVDALKKCTELRKNWLVAHNELGFAYRQLKDYNNAVENFKRVTEIDSKFAPGFYNLAEAQFRGGNLKDAKKTQDKLRKLNPNMANQLEVLFLGGALTNTPNPAKNLENKIKSKLPY